MVSRHHICVSLCFKFVKEGAILANVAFSCKVLLGVLGFKAVDFFCLISLTHGFDMTFQIG